MKYLLCLLLIYSRILISYGQDSISHRLIFIGDAGEMDAHQIGVINNASGKIIANKTSVIYLGDNIYPTGMGLIGSKEEKQTEDILRSQYTAFRKQGAPVYFIPGNHDWDKMGPDGLQKIKRQWSFLEQQGDSLLKMLPANGCPGPVEIPVDNNTVIIAFDSEWWLFPYSKLNPEAECECKTKEEIIAKLEELLYKNQQKTILLLSHHPFQSYGHHGGYFNAKDHIFPFTAINKNLYIPLPIVGSLYPFFRITFPNSEDLRSPLYENMVKRVNTVFVGFPNMVHLSGHEHGLQLIKSQQLQIVSGSGSKNNFVKKGKDALYASKFPGYVTADVLINNSIRFTYYANTGSAFEQVFTYLKECVPVKKEEERYARPIKEDSLVVRVHARYDSVSKFRRFVFGENYRKEFAAPTKLPVIKLSEIKGGLIPTQRGGGHQSVSIRLKDKNGKEWVLRSIEKYPEVLIPENLRETFAKDWLNDIMSSQHPFSALVVPPIADAVHVPHANPIIGIVAPEKVLGIYAKSFENKLALLEEREPMGKSDNTPKMIANLNKDNDNTVDNKTYLRSRILDLLIGDWDRHADQWRWAYDKDKKNKHYMGVPRDRDQVFYVNQGLLPSAVTQKWLLPYLEGFDGKIKDVNTFFWETRELDSRFLIPLSHDEWMRITSDFVTKVPDNVLENGLSRLPESSYKIRHDHLLKTLQERRSNLVREMDIYYKFIHKIVDIQCSDKNELIMIHDTPEKGLNVLIRKITKNKELKDTLYQKEFDPKLTKEIRIYSLNGSDSLVLNNANSGIKIRIIGNEGGKGYNIIESKQTVQLYGKTDNISFTGNDTRKLDKHLSNDSINTAFDPVNLYNVPKFLIAGGYNLDDGVLLGIGYKYIKQEGFRKKPYANMHQISAVHSFSTKAYRIRYNSEWIHSINKADITFQALINAPNNTMNFFGRGNETPLDKTGDYKTYYRTRFSTYIIDPALRWRYGSSSSISIGPSLQYYTFDSDENTGRFINNASQIGSYDSSTVNKNKLHLGLVINYLQDRRNNKIIPQWGTYINLKLQGYAGVGVYAKSFAQLISEVALFKSLNSKSSVVLAERFGGILTVGKTTFYQSAFIGGQGNLLGYLQFRFAGQHSFYNNLEIRVKIADVASYVLPGQFGIIGFYDIARVWETDESSHKWHNGIGGGIYYSPAQIAVVKFTMGRSTEGWHPYLTLGMRF